MKSHSLYFKKKKKKKKYLLHVTLWKIKFHNFSSPEKVMFYHMHIELFFQAAQLAIQRNKTDFISRKWIFSVLIYFLLWQKR